MSDHDWETSPDPGPMLEVVYPTRSPDSGDGQTRASRMYLLACARRAWARLPGVCRAAVAAAERVYHRKGVGGPARRELREHAERLVHCRGNREKVNEVARHFVRVGLAARFADVSASADVPPTEWAGYAYLAYLPFEGNTPDVRRVPPELHCADLLREAFGNPFGPDFVVPPGWLTAEVECTARSAAGDLNSTALGALADALEEAGCGRHDALRHLRDERLAHVRGCWVLEAVLEALHAR